ncbi:3-hydroxyisobutyrate dehydrogenase, NAD-binding domain [Phytophthora cactorum]|nr:3-hydroxyisobutyrate dehydrogenase, NAD-binding domain [Phytophthora cactorum]
MLHTTFLRSTQALRSTSVCRALSTVSSKDQVGVIGLGQMGGRMADNLRKHGHKLVVCDPVPANVRGSATPHHHAAIHRHRRVRLSGRRWRHEALRSEHLLLDSSTIDPIFTKKLSKELHDRGATFVDAPVSGGVAGAQKAQFERVKPLLKAMGKNLVHCGEALCNNLALAIQMASVAEAMNLGTTLGIDPKILKNIMDTPRPRAGQLSSTPNVPSANNYEGGFAVGLHRKDLGLAMDCAKHAEVSIPLTCQVHQLYNMMVACGHGKKDFSYMLQYLKNGK